MTQHSSILITGSLRLHLQTHLLFLVRLEVIFDEGTRPHVHGPCRCAGS
jgi:hypothetical protein